MNKTILVTGGALRIGSAIVASFAKMGWDIILHYRNSFEEAKKIKEIVSKLKCVSFYKDEIREYPFPRSYEGIKTLSKMRGMQSGCNFAEAFHIERKIVI